MTDSLSAKGSDLEQSPYIVGDGFLISNEFFWLPNEALTSSNHLIVSAMYFLSAMNFSGHLVDFFQSSRMVLLKK